MRLRFAMRSIIRHRPALDTVLGLVAILIAVAWTITVMTASHAGESTPNGGQPAANLTYVVGDPVRIPNRFVENAFADCPAGQTVLGGGYWTNDATIRIVQSWPQGAGRTGAPKSWAVAASNQPPFDAIEGAMLGAYAICARPGEPVVAP